jgi:hypothetical protein
MIQGDQGAQGSKQIRPTFDDLAKDHDKPLSEKNRRARNWNLARLCICLTVFFLFDIASREILF